MGGVDNVRFLVGFALEFKNTENGSNIFYRATTDATDLQSLTDVVKAYPNADQTFSAKSAVVVTFEDLVAAESSVPGKATFQIIAVGDGDKSAMVLDYKTVTIEPENWQRVLVSTYFLSKVLFNEVWSVVSLL